MAKLTLSWCCCMMPYKMRERTRRGLARVLPVVVALFAMAPASGAGLLVRQHSNGLPGMARNDVLPQMVKVGHDAMRIDSGNAADKAGRSLIVRLDKEVFWELDHHLRLYIAKPFSFLREQRLKAEAEREEARQAALERLRGEELETYLKIKGMRRDGKRHVTVTKGVEVRIGRYKAVPTHISINGKLVISVWESFDIPEYKQPPELLGVYNKGGLFCDEVTQALKAIEGFPVQVYAHIDFFAVGAKMHTRVDTVVEWPEDKSAFAIPEGYRLVRRFPRIAQASDSVTCQVCKKELAEPNIRTPGGKGFVCSKGCGFEYIKDPKKYRHQEP